MKTDNESGRAREDMASTLDAIEQTVVKEYWRDTSAYGALLGLLILLILSPLIVHIWNPCLGKDWSEIVKNVVESLAVLGGVAGVVAWLYQRKDRATDILLKLEQDCFGKHTAAGRIRIEEEKAYGDVKLVLEKIVEMDKDNKYCPNVATLTSEEAKMVGEVDRLLRFYVVLDGVRQARQVPDSSLSTCYRFWLAHYYHPGRPAFKNYVDAYFPTLRNWLADDAKCGSKFFRPTDFGWKTP